MADLTNRAVALLLVAAVAVSIFGAVLTLNRMAELTPTGFATSADDSGQAQINVSAELSIRFNQAVINFGTGYVNASSTYCPLGTNGTTPQMGLCVDFNTTIDEGNLTIENTGNLVANLSLNFTKDADAFIGGTTPEFKYRVTEPREDESCLGPSRNASNVDGAYANTNFDNVVEDTYQAICDNFLFDNGNDELHVELFVRVPENSLQGAQTVQIEAIACDDKSCYT